MAPCFLDDQHDLNAAVISVASERLKFHIVFSIAVATVAMLATWVILDDRFSLAPYLERNHVLVANVTRMTVILPFILSAVISRNPHSPPTSIFIVGLFLQWSMIGLVLSVPFAKRWLRGRQKT